MSPKGPNILPIQQSEAEETEPETHKSPPPNFKLLLPNPGLNEDGKFIPNPNATKASAGESADWSEAV